MKSNLAIALAFVMGSLFSCDNKQVASAEPPSIPRKIPGCAKERRAHIYGTYRAPFGHDGILVQDLPVDLTIEECLEWEVK